MEDQGAPYGLRQVILDADTVIGDGGIGIGAAGGKKSQLASHAKADHPHLARDSRMVTQRGDGCLDVREGCGLIESGHQPQALLALFGRVTCLQAAFLSPENIRRKHHIPFLGIAVGDGADVLVDPEDFLEQHQARPFPRGR